MRRSRIRPRIHILAGHDSRPACPYFGIHDPNFNGLIGLY
jgi:hypothetical protein